jgi:hypothetical protein
LAPIPKNGVFQPIVIQKEKPIVINSDSPDSPPPLAEITMPHPETLLTEEICDFSDDETFISAVSQNMPETVSKFSSPISSVIERQLKKAA